jgi:hypothetical protein
MMGILYNILFWESFLISIQENVLTNILESVERGEFE